MANDQVGTIHDYRPDPCRYPNAEAFNRATAEAYYMRRGHMYGDQYVSLSPVGIEGPPARLTDQQFASLREQRGCSLGPTRAPEEKVSAHVGGYTPEELANRQRAANAQKTTPAGRQVSRQSSPPPLFSAQAEKVGMYTPEERANRQRAANAQKTKQAGQQVSRQSPRQSPPPMFQPTRKKIPPPMFPTQN
jgi:hypothetical protein